jgi:Flp pilus assembly protein TadD
MTTAQHSYVPLASIATRFVAIAAVSLMLGACSNGAAELGAELGLAQNSEPSAADAGSSDLNKALNYWGRKYVKSPTNKIAALNYAKNLKAAGRNKQAYLVLQQASAVHGNDREIASEYGRLALAQGQASLANKLLSLADDQSRPDWRIVSGRGAALAKLGKYDQAVIMFERAHKLAPSNPTVLNNLAMAHAGSGNLKRAESLLRQASANPMAKSKINKNLALVLKLQGRNAEAAEVGKPQYLASKPAPWKIAKPVSRPTQKVARKRIRRSVAPQLAMRQSVAPETLYAPVPKVALAKFE